MVGRVTRSQSKPTVDPPAKKKEVVKTKAKVKVVPAAAAKAKAKPPKKTAAPKKVEAAVPAEADADATTSEPISSKEDKEVAAEKTVEIEACKQWGAFKSRAEKILKAVGNKAAVAINKAKPGRGNFVVRVSGVDEPIVELLGLKRPFPPLKALDMDAINAKVLNALKV